MKKTSKFLIISFFVFLLSVMLTGCDFIGKIGKPEGAESQIKYTVEFDILNGKITADAQTVIKMTKVEQPTIDASLLPPYATIDGYTCNGKIWDFNNGVTANMTLVANITYDFSSALEIDETESFIIQGVKEGFSDTNLYIPGKINGRKTIISQDAFANCTSLKKIEFGADITINHSAFSGCTNLEEVIIPKTITKIEKNTFNGCTSLKKVVFPEGLKTIDDGAFTNTALTSLEFLNVTAIGKETFKGCTALSELKLPKISSLGQEAFAGCTSLVKFDNDVSTLGEGVFKDCTNLEEVNIRKVTNIPKSAFENDEKLTKVTLYELTNSTITINERAFANCVLLNDINSTRVKYIRDEAFQNCNALTSLDLINVNSIGKNAFSINNGVELADSFEITFADIRSATLTSIGEKAFYNRINYTGHLDFNISKLTTCGNYAFGQTGITSITCHLKTTSSTLKYPTYFAADWNHTEEGGSEEIPSQLVKLE